MAIAAMKGEQLGKGEVTDMLCVSYSQTDVIGHKWGTRGRMTDDAYLTLDRDLGRLIKALDEQVGEGNYLLFLTADHGAAYNYQFMQDHKMNAGKWLSANIKEEAEAWFDGLVGGIEATVYPHSSQTDGERKQGVVDAYVESHTIDDFCRKQALPVSSYFLTMFHQVLHRITREENTLIYFISNGRSELLLDNFFGVLVKTLPSVCNKFREQTSEIARSLNEQMQETIRNDFYPFTKLVERHDLKAEILYNYFVDLQTDVCLGDHHSEEIYGLDWDMAKTPLSITMLRADDGVGYIARIEYDATLYCRQDMETLGNAFKAMSESCCTAAGNELASCRIVLPDAYNQLLQLSKGEQLDFDPNDTFVSLFMQRAAEAPDAIAVVDEEGSYTYGQLDQLSNALAAELRHLGVGADNTASPFVSIMLGYEKAFLVAAIGIEKAGGAYVPLDYEYPNDRLLYMLEDSESQVLVTSHAILNEKTSGGDKFEAKNIFFIDDFLKSEKSAAPVNFATPNGLAYMIYTSGSTGKPKGVMIPHRAKANFVHFIAKEWRLSKQSRICCHSSFSFDASI
jgi:non-ribosomal peptide synthetase component F